MTLFKPCMRGEGPIPAKLMFVGEAPGETEEQLGRPLVGSSGKLFDGMLEQTGHVRENAYITNVLWTRPPNNKLDAFCVPKTDPKAFTQMPALSRGAYLNSELGPELTRLYAEARAVKPNLIVTMGNTATWAFLKQTSISKIRGTIIDSPYGKVLPTYHPAAIFKQWHLRPVLLADLLKAKLEMEFPDVRRPERFIIVNPSFSEISAFYELAARARLISCDIETSKGQITCIGFAISARSALVIPFVDHRHPDKSYWRDSRDEVEALRWVQRFLMLPQPKVFQNGLYDLQYIRAYKLRVVNILHDTMLAHHALHPELLKGLGFMGSIYTNEPAWKLMRERGEEVLKRDE